MPISGDDTIKALLSLHPIADLLDIHEATDDAVAREIGRQLMKTKQIKLGKGKNATVIEVEDNRARQWAVETIMDIKGMRAAEKQHIDQTVNVNVVNFGQTKEKEENPD